MPAFHYRALAPDGEILTGTLDKTDEREAVRHLQEQGHLPLHVSTAPGNRVRALLDTEITPRQALAPRRRPAFVRALATLVDAGLPVDRALEIVSRLGTGSDERGVAARVLERVRGGRALSQALTEEKNALSPLSLAMLRAAEAGADLGPTLTRLATMLETEMAQRSELRSAMIYPAFLILTAIGSVALLMVYVVPTFEPLLADAGVEPPLVTRLVVITAGFVRDHGILILCGFVLAALIGAFVTSRPAVEPAWHRFCLGLPVLGSLWRTLEAARFSRALGTLLTNGVALPTALALSAAALGNAAIAEAMRRAGPEVEAGRGLARPLAECTLLPPLLIQLVSVGEESGSLAPMLLKAADIFETETRTRFRRAISLLTPTLTLLLGGLIAVIVSSILFALFSINELAL